MDLCSFFVTVFPMSLVKGKQSWGPHCLCLQHSFRFTSWFGGVSLSLLRSAAPLIL